MDWLHLGAGFKWVPLFQYYYNDGINFNAWLWHDTKRMKCPLSCLISVVWIDGISVHNSFNPCTDCAWYVWTLQQWSEWPKRLNCWHNLIAEVHVHSRVAQDTFTALKGQTVYLLATDVLCLNRTVVIYLRHLFWNFWYSNRY
jgi:hypothetical protein